MDGWVRWIPVWMSPLSCHHRVSALPRASWRARPSGLLLGKKHVCVIPSYCSVSSRQRSRVIVGKLIGFAGVSAAEQPLWVCRGPRYASHWTVACQQQQKPPSPQIPYRRWICHPCITPSAFTFCLVHDHLRARRGTVNLCRSSTWDWAGE